MRADLSSLSESTSDAGDAARFVVTLEFVLPDAQHSPTCFTKRPVYQAVAGLVPRQFLPPENSVRSRLAGVERTCVPEAAVHEDSQPLFLKDEVGLSEHGLIPPPAGNAVSPQYPNQRQFCARVPTRADKRHHFRALGLAVDISHRTEGWTQESMGCS